MVGNPQVQQLMSDDEILEIRVLIGQVGGTIPDVEQEPHFLVMR